MKAKDRPMLSIGTWELKRAREIAGDITSGNRAEFRRYVEANFSGNLLGMPMELHLGFSPSTGHSGGFILADNLDVRRFHPFYRSSRTGSKWKYNKVWKEIQRTPGASLNETILLGVYFVHAQLQVKFDRKIKMFRFHSTSFRRTR